MMSDAGYQPDPADHPPSHGVPVEPLAAAADTAAQKADDWYAITPLLKELLPVDDSGGWLMAAFDYDLKRSRTVHGAGAAFGAKPGPERGPTGGGDVARLWS